MKVLLVKTSSLGDLIHCMPAVQDLSEQCPDIELHWLVEEGFRDIPTWHPFVKKVHCYANRRWRKSKFSKQTRQEIKALKQQLRAEQFDKVIDAQGLLKSALPVRWLKGEKYGYDRHSIREPIAAFFYDKRFSISLKKTAITRNRALLAWAFDYSVDEQSPVNFGLKLERPASLPKLKTPYTILLHGTNWLSKVWPIAHWQQLARELIASGRNVYIPFSNDDEKQRAEFIAKDSGALVLEKMSLSTLTYIIQESLSVVGCDTGLSHISAALAKPTVVVYGASNSKLTGVIGQFSQSLQSDKACSPCMKSECPLVQDQSAIPCYDSVNVDQVLTSLVSLEEKAKGLNV